MLKLTVAVLLVCLNVWIGHDVAEAKSKTKLRQYYTNPKYLYSFYKQDAQFPNLWAYLKVGCEASFTNKTEPFARISVSEVKGYEKIRPHEIGRSKIVTIGSRVSDNYLCMSGRYKVITKWFNNGLDAKKDKNCRWKQTIHSNKFPQLKWLGSPKLRDYVLRFQSIVLPGYYLSVRIDNSGHRRVFQPSKEYFKLSKDDKWRAESFLDDM